MKLKFSKKEDYKPLDVIDEIVRAALFEDYESLSGIHNEELRDAYRVVLEYITCCSDKRLEVFDTGNIVGMEVPDESKKRIGAYSN